MCIELNDHPGLTWSDSQLTQPNLQPHNERPFITPAAGFHCVCSHKTAHSEHHLTNCTAAASVERNRLLSRRAIYIYISVEIRYTERLY